MILCGQHCINMSSAVASTFEIIENSYRSESYQQECVYVYGTVNGKDEKDMSSYM